MLDLGKRQGLEDRYIADRCVFDCVCTWWKLNAFVFAFCATDIHCRSWTYDRYNLCSTTGFGSYSSDLGKQRYQEIGIDCDIFIANIYIINI